MPGLRLLFSFSICCLALFFFSVECAAQLMVIPTQGMDYGSFVIRDFNLVSRLIVDEATGVVTAGANTIPLIGGQNGQFALTGGPTNTAFTVTLDATVPPILGGASFAMDRFRVAPVTLQTDGIGDDTFSIGMRATSSGGGTVYTDGGYSGTYDFTVQF